MKTYTLKGTEFTSSLSNDEAAAILDGKTGNFPQSLARQWHNRRRWSATQEAWAHKMATEGDTPAPVRDGLNAANVVAIFQAAVSAKLKYPKVTLQTEDHNTVRFQRVNSGPNTGCINITDGRRYGENTWYGRIGLDGRWTQPRSPITADVVQMVEAFCADPMTTAREHGHMTGCCCFCNLRLTTDESVTLGYGPVCAKKWGLGHGKAAARQATNRVMTEVGTGTQVDQPLPPHDTCGDPACNDCAA